MQIFQAPPRIDWIRNHASWPSNLCINRPSRWFLRGLEFENHCSEASFVNPKMQSNYAFFQYLSCKTWRFISIGLDQWGWPSPSEKHQAGIHHQQMLKQRLDTSACPFSVRDNSRRIVLDDTCRAKLECFCKIIQVSFPLAKIHQMLISCQNLCWFPLVLNATPAPFLAARVNEVDRGFVGIPVPSEDRALTVMVSGSFWDSTYVAFCPHQIAT